jgi:hypothetical protein
METLLAEKISHQDFGNFLQNLKSENDEFSNFLVQNGKGYLLDEWLTIKEYTKKYNLQSTNVVSNWIKRGIIPQDCILETKFNDLKLIKNQVYQG